MSSFLQHESRCSTDSHCASCFRRICGSADYYCDGESCCDHGGCMRHSRVAEIASSNPLLIAFVTDKDMTRIFSPLAPVFAGLLALTASFPAVADLSGFLEGRSVDPGKNQTLSIEVGFQDIDGARSIGPRVNFKVAPNIMAFANIANVDFGSNVDGFSVGGGAYIALPNQRIWTTVDAALKPSLTFISADNGPAEIDFISLGFEAVVSGKKPIGSTPLNWFANAGLALTDVDSNFGASDTEVDLILGGGAYLLLGPGQLYFGAEIFDGDFSPGIGYRFNL